MSKQVRKPVKWVSSVKRDLNAMPKPDMDLINIRLKAAKQDFEVWLAQQGARK